MSVPSVSPFLWPPPGGPEGGYVHPDSPSGQQVLAQSRSRGSALEQVEVSYGSWCGGCPGGDAAGPAVQFTFEVCAVPLINAASRPLSQAWLATPFGLSTAT